VVEIVGGYLFTSLALFADAAHMTSDVLALTLALIALILAQRPPTERHTFGFERTEVLAAQANGVLLAVGAIWIVVEAARRLQNPEPIDAKGVLIVGGLGLLVNVGSAFVVARAAHGNLNLRAALWHLMFDALGSLAVVIAAIGTMAFDTQRLDSIASIAIAVLVVGGAWRLLRDSTRVLLEAVPTGVDVGAVRAALAEEPGVEAVHHLHVWTVGAEHTALSAHVVLAGPLSLHEAQERSVALKQVLSERFGIDHATLEVECHACIDDEVHALLPSAHDHNH
jgi:cobalt-zinc-cadmium efflux system protein